MATFAPIDARPSQTAAPMPPYPPVTSATLPSSPNSVSTDAIMSPDVPQLAPAQPPKLSQRVSAPAIVVPPMSAIAGAPVAFKPETPPDPYVLAPDAVEAPPVSFGAALRRIGPGMVLAASIVGSGELIATTTLGAQVGFLALWIILLSCAIKPVVQAELGRYTIASGYTGLEGFNRVPGPRAGVSWLVWAWAITVTLTLLQVGGMYGGVAQVLHLLVP